MQDANIESMSETTRLVGLDWAMKWLALHARKQQSTFDAKAV